MPGSSAGLNEKKRRKIMCYGYKYTVSEGKVYIVTLICNNVYFDTEFEKMPVCYYSTDCIVVRINDANTGVEINEIIGLAYRDFKYKKGDRIKGEDKIYFCKTRLALYCLFLYKKKNGEIGAFVRKDPKTKEKQYQDDFESFCFPEVRHYMYFVAMNDLGFPTTEEQLNRYLARREKEYWEEEPKIEDVLKSIEANQGGNEAGRTAAAGILDVQQVDPDAAAGAREAFRGSGEAPGG